MRPIVDRFIASFPAIEDCDLMLCREHGVAYQKDRTNLVAYDEAYYSRCQSYENQEIANRINAGRIEFVAKHFGNGPVIDVGIGSGEFIKKRPNTWGFDVNPVGIEWLKRNDRWSDRLSDFRAVTFWDVIEHCDEPEIYLSQVPEFAFMSLPIFYGLGGIRLSKHYRPGEHLTYFECDGLVHWMSLHGFLLKDVQDFEIEAGRESIYSFAFKRFRWQQ